MWRRIERWAAVAVGLGMLVFIMAGLAAAGVLFWMGVR